MTQLSRILDDDICEHLADHERRGGGEGLRSALERSPAAVIEEVTASGLRGRGGAGFPTGAKWRTVAQFASQAGSTPVVVNAAEGEPGSFKDRALIRRNPYRVLEGAVIASLAVGSGEIVVGVKASFRTEIERLGAALAEMRGAGWLEGIEARIVQGPPEYLYGEETAMLEVIEGRPPFPRVTPPYRRGVDVLGGESGGSAAQSPMATQGSAGAPPALVDNVETLANLPGILERGASWFRSVGTERSPGTIVCTVTGSTQRQGVGEFAMGTPLRGVIESLGGGVPPGRHIAMVLSGVSNPPVVPDALDTPLTYEDMDRVGSGLGSASFIVLDDTVAPVRAAAASARFLAVESCGQCERCKADGLAVADALDRAEPDVSTARERLLTVADGARCALAGQIERVAGSLLDLADRADRAPGSTDGGYTVAPLVDIVPGGAVLDDEAAQKRPDWTGPGEEETDEWPVNRLADRPVDVDATAVHATPAVPPPAREGRRDHPGATDDPFAPLEASHERLIAAIDELRHGDRNDRGEAVVALRDELRRHVDITDRVVYPLLTRVVAEAGDDIVWYPERHEHEAMRVLDRLADDEAVASARVADDICADVHRSIIEIEREIIALLDERLDDEQRDLLLRAFVDDGLTRS